MRRKKRFIFILISVLFCMPVYSWDGSAEGYVSRIDVTESAYNFRVYLEGQPALCGNENIWGYLDETDPNYQTYVSVLMMAKATKNKVKLYLNRQNGAAGGKCHIGYVILF